METPWIYLYLARWSEESGAVRQRKYTQIALAQFTEFGVARIFGVARWGKCSTDVQDRRLGQGPQEILLVPLRGELSPTFMGMLAPADPVLLREEIDYMPISSLGLLVLKTIFAVDWHATFRDVKLFSTGCYLYYNFDTGAVCGFLAETRAGVPAVTPVFRAGDRLTLAESEAEAARLRQRRIQPQVDQVFANWGRVVQAKGRQELTAIWH